MTKTKKDNKKIKNKAANENKGFTLVELIVVIVILAILAAILVPALLGYVDKAKKQKDFLKAKSCMTATQAILSEYYAKGKAVPTISTSLAGSSTNQHIFYITDDDFIKDVLRTADLGDNECGQLTFGCSGPMFDDAGNIRHDGYTIVFYSYATYELPATYAVFDGKTWVAEDNFNVESKQADYIYVLANN